MIIIILFFPHLVPTFFSKKISELKLVAFFDKKIILKKTIKINLIIKYTLPIFILYNAHFIFFLIYLKKINTVNISHPYMNFFMKFRWWRDLTFIIFYNMTYLIN